MRIHNSLAIVFIGAAAMVAPTSVFGQSAPCQPSNSMNSHFHGMILYTVTADTSDHEEMARRTRRSMVALDSTDVSLKTDSPTCTSARTAMRAMFSVGADSIIHPDSITPLVVKIGPNYAVTEYRIKSGEWTAGVTFDSTWTAIKEWVW